MLQIASAPLSPQLDRAAREQGNQLLILGHGDGSVLEQIRAHALLRAKPTLLLLLAGERAPADSDGIMLERCRDTAEAMDVIHRRWGRVERVPEVVGLSIIDEHPISAPAAVELRQQIRGQLADRLPACGNDIHDGLDGVRHAVANAGQLLAAPDLGDLQRLLGRTPVISIAAGPSLAQHLDQLRALQDRCLLVACDAVFAGLVEAGIRPHLVTPLERDIGPVKLLCDRAGNSGTWFAGLPVIRPEAVAAFADRQLLVPGMDTIYDWYCPGLPQRVNTGSSTGVLSMTVGAMASRGPVYLVGHDLALAAESTHWAAAAHSSTCMAAARASDADRPTNGNAPRLVPGNDGGQLPSIIWWDRFRQEIGTLALWLHAQQQRYVYNVNMVTKTGAFIDGCRASRLPRPEALPRLPDFAQLPHHPERLDAWRGRLRQLPADWSELATLLQKALQECDRALAAGPDSWRTSTPLQLLQEQRLPSASAQLIRYLLRSALLGGDMELQAARRCAHPLQADLQRLLRARRLVQQLQDVHRHLEPLLMELLHAGND